MLCSGGILNEYHFLAADGSTASLGMLLAVRRGPALKL
jgi:hypothetical protein